ncbi:MAG: caspase family protein, partial [Myxococcota bacterium]
MIAQLYSKTEHVVVISDSCNSASVSRDDPGRARPRWVAPRARMNPVETAPAAGGDGAEGWLPEGFPGLVALSAAGDGTPAIEIGGRGIFTDALLEVLSGEAARDLSYAQLGRRARPLVAARSYQIPYFQGALDQPVFGSGRVSQPWRLEVTELLDGDGGASGHRLRLAGPPLPGLGVGAELRVYDGSADAGTIADPAEAKALAVVTEATGLNAVAVLEGRPRTAARRGDVAVLAMPGEASTKVTVSLRGPDLPGGIPDEAAESIRTAIRGLDESQRLITLVDRGGDYVLLRQPRDRVGILGPEGRLRATVEPGRLAGRLWPFARQQALRSLRGEGGQAFRDHETLSVSLVPAAKQTSCATGKWTQAEANRPQTIPLCHRYRVRVELEKSSPEPLLVGGVVLSSDGSVFGFPSDGKVVRLEAGQSVVFDELFQGQLPLGAWDEFLIFGSQEENPIPWHLL